MINVKAKLVVRFVALVTSIALSVSCMTTYDPYGRPMTTVDPALAVTGVVAAGLIGYAAGRDNNCGYYGGGGYHGGYRPYGCYR